MLKPASACIVFLATVLTLAITADAQSPGVTLSKTALHSSTQARLRQALPFPEASLSRKMALSLGIGFSPERGFYLQTGAEAAEASWRVQALWRTLHRKPHEAPRYELLAKYERYLGQEAHAKRDFTRAATLYHQQTIGRTSSTHTETALVGRSRALGEIGQARKGEIELRQALRSHPRAWRLWDALGDVKSNQAEAALSNTTRGDTAAITRALRIDDDACACFNRAIRAALRQGFAYAARGEYLGFERPNLRDEGKRLRGGAAPSFEMTIAPASPADFRTAAQLLPSEPYAIAYPVWQEVSDLGFFHLHLPFPSQAAWRAMPASTKRAARGAIQQLTQLSRRPNKRLARRADVALGFLLFETQRVVTPSETALRHGVLGSDHQEAAEMLMHVMSLENQ